MPYVRRERVTLDASNERGEPYWVEVRPLAYAEEQELQFIMLGQVPINLQQFGTAEALPDVVRVDQLGISQVASHILLRCITGWNLDGFDGQVLPITAATINELGPDQRLVLATILRHADGTLRSLAGNIPAPEDAQAFTSASTGSSPMTVVSTRPTRGETRKPGRRSTATSAT